MTKSRPFQGDTITVTHGPPKYPDLQSTILISSNQNVISLIGGSVGVIFIQNLIYVGPGHI